MNCLVFRIIAFLFAGDYVNCVKIQFFRNRNLTGLSYESSSTAKCNNVPAIRKDVYINSIKTDTCLMVYMQPNCKLGYGSRKFDLDNPFGARWPVRSFHICNDDVGGPQLKIDINKNSQLAESGLLESYRDVCTCINIPQYVQNMTLWSINSYGNDFLAYYQPNCSEIKWKAEHIPAGFQCTGGSQCMDQYEKIDSVTNTTYRIQSIGPNPNSKYFKRNCKQIAINNQLRAKDEQLGKQIETLLTEMKSMKEKTAEMESKQENHHRGLEDSIENLKVEFENFG